MKRDDPENQLPKRKKKIKSVYQSFAERLLLIPVLILALLVLAGWAMNEWLIKPIEKDQQNLNRIEQLVSQLNHQIAHYERYSVEFETEVANQLSLPIDRIVWVDRLAQHTQAEHITNLSVSFGQETRLNRTQASRWPVDQGVFFQTPITVDIGLYHEGDLLGFTDWLRSEFHPHLWLTSCELTLADTELDVVFSFNPQRPNIRALCQYVAFRAELRLFDEQEWR